MADFFMNCKLIDYSVEYDGNKWRIKPA
jgi:hypothetical protein